MARPATGTTPLQHTRVPQDDWDDLRAVAGRGAAKVIREFIRWYLRRPGAKMPVRPSVEEIEVASASRKADTADDAPSS